MVWWGIARHFGPFFGQMKIAQVRAKQLPKYFPEMTEALSKSFVVANHHNSTKKRCNKQLSLLLRSCRIDLHSSADHQRNDS